MTFVNLGRHILTASSNHLTSRRPDTVAGLVALSLAVSLAACSPPPTPPSDATPPVIESHAPLDGEDNVAVDRAIAVQFSEPLEPATVNDGTVQLAGSGSVNIAKSLSLADDGLLTITPVASLALPQSLTLSLGAGIEDLAGNALAPATWSWTVPTWLRLGADPALDVSGDTFVFWSHLALDSLDRPVVAGNREESPHALISRWDGADWTSIEPPSGPLGDAFVNDLAVDTNDDVIVAWSGSFDSIDADDQYVSRWDGSAWTLLGGGLLLGAAYPVEAALALTAAGDPVVAYSQAATPGNSPTDLYAKRWTGSAWVGLGGKLEVNDDAAAQTIDIALDQNDNPVVSWGERFFGGSFVKIWNPTTVSWQALGGSVSPIESAPPLLVRANGELVTAINHADGKLHLLAYTGVGWQTIGAPLGRSTDRFAGTASLAENADGEVVVGWPEFGTTDSAVNVATMTDGGWEYAGAEIAASRPATLSNVRLVLIGGTTPAIAYTLYQPHQDASLDFDADTLFRYLNR